MFVVLVKLRSDSYVSQAFLFFILIVFFALLVWRKMYDELFANKMSNVTQETKNFIRTM